ncbi:MAG: hypothetical protein RL148_25 [Planctomycetota bacterium]
MQRNHCLGLAALACAAAACDDSNHWSVSGTVYNQFSEPMAGVEVVLQWPEISLAELPLTTDGEGRYSYSWEQAEPYGSSVLARVRITPRASGWAFDPAHRELEVEDKATGLDFVGTLAEQERWLFLVLELTWETDRGVVEGR